MKAIRGTAFSALRIRPSPCQRRLCRRPRPIFQHRTIGWIAADVVGIADGVLVEHWDVLQDEATGADSQNGLPMFGEKFQE